MFAFSGHHDPVDEDPGNTHLLRRGRCGEEPLDLRDHDPAAVPHRLGDRQDLADDRFLVHHQAAGGIGRARPDQRHVERQRLVPQPGLAADLHPLNERLGRARVEPPPGLERIDEGAEADVRDAAGAAGCDVAKQVADHPLGKVVGLDLVGHRQCTEPRAEPPVAPDHPLEKAGVGEMIEPARPAVALAGRIDERQIAGVPGG